MNAKNAKKISCYEAGIKKNHYADLDAAIAGCEARGDGNYRVTLDTHPPERCNDGSGRDWNSMPILPVTWEIEVRGGKAEQV